MASDAPGLGTRTLRGMLWAYGSYVGGRLLVLASVAVLARLLDPADFGLVAFALTVTALLDTIADLGVGQALVVSTAEEVERRADTAWTISLALGAGLAVVAALLSPLAAAGFGETELAPLLAVLALNFPLRALGATHFALAQRQLEFRTRTVAEVSDVVVRGGTGVVLALSGAGAWSLVLGYLAGSAAMSAVLWRLVPFRPRLAIRRDALSGLLNFGGALTALNVLTAVITNVDYLLVGRVLGPGQLGLYSLGYRLPELLIMNLSVVAGIVLFPSFAGLARRAMAEAFLLSLRYTLMVAAPLAAALVVLAEPLVLALFGDRWAASVPVMQVLAAFAFAVAVGIPAGTAYKATRRVAVLLRLGIPRAVLAVGAVAIFVDRGIVAVAISQAAVAGLFSVIGVALAARLLGTGLRAVAGAVWPALAGAGAAAAAGSAVQVVVDGTWAALLAAGPAMALAYTATIWLAAPDAVRRLYRMALGAPAPAPESS